MGKDLKGKELGRNISQEKNGYYLARFVDKNGKRVAKRFKKLQECRQWVADAMFEDEHSDLKKPHDMTVDAWYEHWIENKRNTTKPSTVRDYTEVYELHVKKDLGDMLLKDVRPINCQNVLNKLSKEHRNSYLSLVKTCMHNMFSMAIDNELIQSNPCGRSVKCNIGVANRQRECLTIGQQKQFLEVIKGHRVEDHFRFVLQTGLRCGELIGLHWDDIDLKKKIMFVRRTTFLLDGRWVTNSPKTESGIRTVPLNKEALRIIQKQKDERKKITVLPIQWKDNVFLDNNGEGVYSSKYNAYLKQLCAKNEMKRFSMHSLRHTFATRCIEAGMKPKILQKILGHAKIDMTMNLYVHATEEEKIREMDMAEEFLSMVQ